MRDTQDSSDDDYVEMPLVKLDPEMKILNIDVTFDGLGHMSSFDNPQSSQPSAMSLAL
jgi:DNA polymerase sigma